MKTKGVALGMLLIWMALIFFFSSEIADDSSVRSGVIVNVIAQSVSWPENLLTFLTRKAAHIFIYTVLGVLMFNAVRNTTGTRRAVWMSVMFVLMYAVFDEVHQLFVPGRSGEVRDVLIDTMAGSVGVGLYLLGSRVRLATGKIIKNSV